MTDNITAHITALIETYTARLEKYKNSSYVFQREEDYVTWGRSDELGDVIEDLKCVLNARDVTNSDKIIV